MKLPLCVRPITVAVACAMPLAAFALAEAPSSSTFWQDGRDGWFFYETPPEPKPEPEPEPAPAPPPAQAERTPEPISTPEGPTPLSAEWLRENLPRYEDAAWNDPTVENIRAYLYLQQYVVDKSTIFADNYQLAVVGDPVLDTTSRRPLASVPAQRLATTGWRR